MFGWLSSDDGGDDDEEQGCTAHHYGEYEPRTKVEFRKKFIHGVDGDIRVSDHKLREDDVLDSFLVVKRKEVATCQHEDCRARTGRWTTIGCVEDLESLNLVDVETIVESYEEDDDE